MNRAQRRAHDRNQDRAHRVSRRTGRTLLALGSASVVATAGAGAALVLTGPAGALPPPNPTLVVNSLADTSDGTCDVTDCTLREAIVAANTVSGHDEITFSVTGTITLTAALPLITEAVDVHGPGATSLAISGNDTARAFTVKDVDFGSLEFTDLTIEHCQGGDGPAFNLYGSNSTFLIEDVVLQHNFTTYDGGAINFYATGDLTINRSSVLYNSAGGGGALYANADGYGPATGMTVTITNSQFRHNTADDNGGALYLTDLTATITNSTFDTNSADDVAGSGYYGDGGAIFAQATSLTVANSTISGNSADSRGGAIWAEYDYATAPTLAQIEIDNSTISGNDAGTAGGLKVTGRIRTTINQSTITGNSAYYGGSPAVQVDGAYSDRWYNSISGSILVGNTAAGSPSDLGPANTAPRLTVDASLIGWFSNYFDEFTLSDTLTGVAVADVALGALADNGGPTKTMALGAGSWAIDAGPSPVASFTGNTTDQRGTGYDRVVNGTVDIGAYEVQAALPPPPTALNLTALGGRSARLTWTAPASGPTPTGYQIRCLPQGTPVDVGPGGPVVYVGATTTSADIADLVGGTTYVCHVRARYGAVYFSWLGDSDEGPLSAASNTLVVAATVPAVPGRVTASPPAQPSGQATSVGFVAPENRSGAPITRFDARCTSSNGGTTRTGSGAASPVGVGNLTKGRTYTCVVSAVNSVGPSAWSAASARIVVPAGPVTDVRASTPTAGNRRTTVSFTPPVGGPTPVRYWVECRTADGASVLTGSEARGPVTVRNLVRGRTYTCRVWAIFDGGVLGPVSTASNAVRVP